MGVLVICRHWKYSFLSLFLLWEYSYIVAGVAIDIHLAGLVLSGRLALAHDVVL